MNPLFGLGKWVVVDYGRVGRVSKVWPASAVVEVQLGSAGPFELWLPSMIRRATLEEERAAQGR